MDQLFAVTAPGLEQLTAFELQQLGLLAAPTTEDKTNNVIPGVEAGGVTFRGKLDEIYRANLQLRTTSRVLIRIGHFYAASFSELRKKASRLNWPRFVTAGQSVAVRATCHKSKLYHSAAVAERIYGAIEDRLGAPVMPQKVADEDADNPPQLIVVRIVNNQCTVSVDTSGELLHRRGYRQAVAKAPLRETFAAALLLAAKWDSRTPLLDPFCGSGAIPIEAALMARGMAPGSQRRFAFMDWPGFDEKRWQALVAQSVTQIVPASDLPPIVASDRDAGAIRMARENAERAGVADNIEFHCRTVSALQAPSQLGWVVTNPPYGVRVSADNDLRNLYAQFGKVLRANCKNWHVAILCADQKLLGQTGLKLDSSFSFTSGGIKVRLGRGIVTEASRRA